MNLHFKSVRASVAILCASLAVWTVGCGQSGPAKPKSYPFSGKVTFEGKPLTTAKAHIDFFDKKTATAAVAELKSDGTFQVPGGLWAADYEVTINPPAPKAGEAKTADEINRKPPEPPADIPAKYQSTATSGMKVTVKDAKNPPFEVDMKP
jgi:hypothetical protein